jgi:myo-inositol 2-dehydrogenase/D-chiro-inositol 1-dehydrogenase
MTENIGLVGTGRIGRIHAENLAYRVPGARLVALTDVDRAGAEKCARDFHVPHVAQDLDEILNNKEIHAVAICSSTDTHAPMIIAAARAGKHIFCEKPIALNLASIDQALAAVEKSGVKFMVGFNRRYHPNFKKIRDLVAAGKIGKPHLVRITSRDCAPPPLEYVKVSGGIFLDMTIHDFDMARYLVGGEVTSVFATGSVLINPAIGGAGDVDTAVVVMSYENGAICTIDKSREAVYGYDQRVEVFGSGGVLTCSNRYPDSVVSTTKESTSSSLPYFGMLDIYRETYVDELAAFVEAVENDTVPPITGKDGRIPLVMGLAAGRSLREHRPVKLSEIG